MTGSWTRKGIHRLGEGEPGVTAAVIVVTSEATLIFVVMMTAVCIGPSRVCFRDERVGWKNCGRSSGQGQT